MNESCRIWMRHVTVLKSCARRSRCSMCPHLNEGTNLWRSHVAHEWVMSPMKESCCIWMSRVTYEWVMSHMNESRHTLLKSCARYVWCSVCPHHGHTLHSESRITDMIHSYVTWLRHDSFICDMPSKSRISYMIHSYVTWLIHMQHDSLSHVTYEWIMSLIRDCIANCEYLVFAM